MSSYTPSRCLHHANDVTCHMPLSHATVTCHFHNMFHVPFTCHFRLMSHALYMSHIAGCERGRYCKAPPPSQLVGHPPLPPPLSISYNMSPLALLYLSPLTMTPTHSL